MMSVSQNDKVSIGYNDEKAKGPNQTPDPSYRQLTPKDNSKFHDIIKEKDWDRLKKMIAKYKANYYKRKRIEARNIEKDREQREEEENAKEEKEDEEQTKFEKFRRRLPFANRKELTKVQKRERNEKAAKKVLPKFVTKKMFVDPAEIVSPLLMVDSDGRTPLHLACLHKAPEKMLLDILAAEKRAASMKDNSGQLPLHCAIKTWQFEHVLERIIKACPNALKFKDNNGRSPLGFAVECALQGRPERDDDSVVEDPDYPFLWIYPTSSTEKSWQFEQEMSWAKVNCLLRAYIDRRKTVLPSEHGLILEALEAGADPNTIVRFITTSDRFLMLDDELAGTAIGLCTERHYNVDTLKYLLENCREKTTVISDIVQKAMKAHYGMGCYPLRDGMVPFGKQVIDWAKKEERDEEERGEKRNGRDRSYKRVSFRMTAEEDKDYDDDEKKKWAGMNNECKGWWEILNHLLFYYAYGRDFEEKVKPKTYHLLHAALSAPMTPPSLVHLLLITYPKALHEKCPLYKALPIHIACTRWRYDVIYDDSDISSLEQVLLHLYESDPDQLFQRHKGSLPIHMALFGGQFWDFIKIMASDNWEMIGMRDAQSRLFPFQIAALPIRFRNVQLLMRSEYNSTEWRNVTFAEKKMEYEQVMDEQETRQLGTIFELLREYPDAIENRVATKEASIATGHLSSQSDLSIHYLSWIYNKNSDGKYGIRYDNLEALRNSILEARVLPELEDWWNGLKECIWKHTHEETPKTTDFLLHSALYNAETPPIVTELLIQLYPSSVKKPIPGTSKYPLHIAAATTKYQSQQFEIPYGLNNLRLVLKAYKEAVRFKSDGRLPLHICLSRGKSWKEVLPLIVVDPSSLKVEDEHTGLVPFELMASFNLGAKQNSWWYSSFTERQMKTFSFDQLSTKDKAKALSRARKKKELSQLNCIFELIRYRPSVLSMRYSGLGIDIDDDSETGLNSFVDEGYDARGGIERWETDFDDSSVDEYQKESSRSLLSRDDAPPTPALLSPLDAPSAPYMRAKVKLMGSKSSKPYRRGTGFAMFKISDLAALEED